MNKHRRTHKMFCPKQQTKKVDFPTYNYNCLFYATMDNFEEKNNLRQI